MLKTCLLLAAFACPAGAACVTEACPKPGEGRGGGAVPAAVGQLINVNLTVVNLSRALAAAQARLTAQVRSGFPARRPPEPAAVRAVMKLTLRLNNAWLQSPGGARAWPGDDYFSARAEKFLGALAAYCARLDKAHAWGPNDDAAANNLLRRELKGGLARLPAYRGRGLPPAPPPSADEREFFPGER